MGREIKRVALDFTWPINGMIWKGYHNPYSGLECSECDGSGYGPEAKRLSDDWYSHLGSGWGKRLTQEDVDALIAADRLWDFTRVPRTTEQQQAVRDKVAAGGNSWLLESNGYTPTADEVNEWASKGMGHDAINHGICVRARCERLGYELECLWCEGHGVLWPSDEFRDLCEHWKGIDPPSGDGYQLWSTTTEGHPMSPVHKSPEDLARWLVDNGASTFGKDTATYEQWLAWINGGEELRASSHYADELIEERDALLRLIGTAPAWHDAPTGPGLWLVRDHDEEYTMQVRRKSPKQKHRKCYRVYGPIPEDEA